MRACSLLYKSLPTPDYTKVLYLQMVQKSIDMHGFSFHANFKSIYSCDALKSKYHTEQIQIQDC